MESFTVLTSPVGKNLTIVVILKRSPALVQLGSAMHHQLVPCDLGTLSSRSGVGQREAYALIQILAYELLPDREILLWRQQSPGWESPGFRGPQPRPL